MMLVSLILIYSDLQAKYALFALNARAGASARQTGTLVNMDADKQLRDYQLAAQDIIYFKPV